MVKNAKEASERDDKKAKFQADLMKSREDAELKAALTESVLHEKHAILDEEEKLMLIMKESRETEMQRVMMLKRERLNTIKEQKAELHAEKSRYDYHEGVR